MRELEREPNHIESGSPALAIIGAGRLGHAIAAAAEAAGVSVRICGRDDAREACSEAGAALLCVPDAAIQEVCEAIAAAPGLRFVGHTSGATGHAPLAAAIGAGAAGFGLHPLQTIPDGDADLGGAPCAVSGSDAAALDFAQGLARRLGMRPFELRDEDRATYHAAASIASNFLVALEQSAAQLLERTGVEGGRELLAPLVLRSAVNWAERGAGALTGPIARGDEATVERHLEAIEERMPELLDLYRALAERTREIAAAERRVPA